MVDIIQRIGCLIYKDSSIRLIRNVYIIIIYTLEINQRSSRFSYEPYVLIKKKKYEPYAKTFSTLASITRTI